MKAHVGDTLHIRSAHIDEPDRRGNILEVHGADGAPPYLIRWDGTGHEALVYPGPDAMVELPE